MAPTVMLVLPTRSYRAGAFLTAAREIGLDVVIAANEPSSLLPFMEDRQLTVDLGGTEESAERAAELAALRSIDAVLGVDESSVLVAAHIAARLGVRHNSVDAVAATRDKRRLRRRLAANGVPQPAAVEITTTARRDDLEAAAAAVGFPCVVKPVDLAASQGVIRADDAGGLRQAVARIGRLLSRPELCGEGPAPLLVEAFVAGPEVAVEGLLDDGRLHLLAVFDKPDPLDGPFFEETLLVTPSRLPADRLADVERIAGAAVVALGLREGAIHAELRLGGDTPAVVEVASRSIGGRCSGAVVFADGEALEAKLLRQACGLPLGDLTLAPGGAGTLMIPIPRNGTLERVEGTGAARSVPGITAVEITVPAGGRIETLPEGDRYLGFVISRAASAVAAEAALRRALGLLRVRVSPPAPVPPWG